MSETHEVIVYRNPLEQKIWHGIMNSDANIGLAIVVLCVVMFISVVILSKIHDMYFPNVHRDTGVRIVLFLSFLFGAVACYFTL